MLKFFIKKTIWVFLVALILWKVVPWKIIGEYRQWKAESARQHVIYLEYSHYVNEVRSNFAKQMLKELGLVCEGDRGRTNKKVEEIGLQFRAYRRATIDEARVLQLYVMEKFIDAINEHEKLRPFLAEVPFTYKRVMISITFKGADGRCAEGGLGWVKNVPDDALEENRNKLFYKSFDPFTGDIVYLHSEPYEEALELVKANPIENIKIHQSTPIEEAIDEVLPAFAEEMRRKCGFECWHMGGKITDFVEEIGGKFSVVKHATQEEARKTTLFAIERLLQALNSSEKLRPYLSEIPFPIDRIKLRINFTKPNHYAYHDESMESVTVVGDQVTYFQLTPLGSGVYPIETPVFATESYQEAVILSSTDSAKIQL